MDKVTPGIYHDKVGVALHDARSRMLNAQPGPVTSGRIAPKLAAQVLIFRKNRAAAIDPKRNFGRSQTPRFRSYQFSL